MATAPDDNNVESLLRFPCEIGIKAMGVSDDGFPDLVLSLIRTHAPELGSEAVRVRNSSGGRYISVTVTLTATSRDQLDAIYTALSDHPDILMAL